MDIALSPVTAVLVPIVIGLVAIVKGYTGSYWAPLSAIVLGVGGSFLIPQVSVTSTILVGIIVGLTAVGLYSGSSTMVSTN